MSFDPSSLLAIARALKEAPMEIDEQARFRSGVSRAYYAAFLSLVKRAKEQLGAENVGQSGIHARMFHALKESRATHLLNIRTSLNRMRDARNEADYELDSAVFEAGDVDDQIERAERLIRSIAQVPASQLQKLRL